MDKSLRFNSICKYIENNNVPRYRITQILRSLYVNKYSSFLSMYHIPKPLRYGLHTHFNEKCLSITPIVEKRADRAHKVLFENRDGSRIETVLLQFSNYTSLCISSQVGCAYSCSFCATGRIGLKRNLDLDEITDQVLYFQQLGHKINSISFMGMGEPLSNPNVFRAIKVLTDKDYFAMSPRRINVSTVGILPGMKRLNKDNPFVNLAYSLHSPFTNERSELVPVNVLYPFQEAFDIMDERIRKTGRRIWISYVLIKDKNDDREHANELVSIIKNRPSDVQYLYHVNLIPLNIAQSVNLYESSSSNESKLFENILKKNKISYSCRNYFGRDIDAACGQLFAEYDPIPPDKLFKPKHKPS